MDHGQWLCLIFMKGLLVFIGGHLISKAGFIVIMPVINHYKSVLIIISRPKERINHYREWTDQETLLRGDTIEKRNSFPTKTACMLRLGYRSIAYEAFFSRKGAYGMSGNIKAWRNPGILLTSTGLAGIGDFIYLVVINILVFQMTGSAAAVAALWIIGPAVNILTKFWTGSFIDHRSKRKVMIGTYVIRAIGIALLPFAPNVVVIYFILIFLSTAKAFFGPASMTYSTMLIPKENRKRFNAVRSVTFSGAFILGPAVGGTLLLVTSIQTTLWLNASFFLLAAYFIKLLPAQEKIVKENIPDLTINQVKNDFSVVMKFMQHHRYVIGVYFGFIVIMVFTFAMDAQEVVFTQEVIGLSEAEYSYLISITGIGSVAGGLLLSIFSAKFPLRQMMTTGLFLTSAGYVIYAFSWSFYSIMTGFLVLGFFLVFLNAGMTTFYQNNVPVALMGRVTSIIQLMQSALQIAFVLFIGIIADLVNLRLTIVVLSLLMLSASLVFPFLLFRKGKAALFAEETMNEQEKAVL